jgi:aspartate ammonia-lyase
MQAGSTSANMNVNEVIANRAIDSRGKRAITISSIS